MDLCAMGARTLLLPPASSLFLNKVHAALGAFTRFVLHDIGVHRTSVLDRVLLRGLIAVLIVILSGLSFAAVDASHYTCECRRHQHGHYPFAHFHDIISSWFVYWVLYFSRRSDPIVGSP
jgi:hypothetical protein